jgi:hypothetical protein
MNMHGQITVAKNHFSHEEGKNRKEKFFRLLWLASITFLVAKSY